MKYSDKEIKEKLTQVFEQYQSDEYFYMSSNFDIVVKENTDSKIVVLVSDMYHTPPLNSVTVQMMCEAFETKHINELDQWHHGGCETCDYGSDYGWEIEILL